MNTLEKLYEYADKSGISIYNRKIHNKKAFAIDTASQRAIALDKKKVETCLEEKVVLSEELGHLECDALCFVSDYTNPLHNQNVKKAEHRAKVWAYRKLIPWRELKPLIIKENSLYEIAEHFNVPCQFLREAMLYYQTLYKIDEVAL